MLKKMDLALETIKPVKYIKIGDIERDTWDSDAEEDGFSLSLRFFSDPESEIRAEGKLITQLYLAGYEFGMVPTDKVKGKLLETWERNISISNFSVGTCGDKKCGFVKDLKFEYSNPNHMVSKYGKAGIIEIDFIDNNKNNFQARKLMYEP